MCPDVVNALLKQTGGVALMTWKECEKHNMAIYKEIFIVDKFAPKKFKEWSDLLKKIDSSLFIRSAHLKKADDSWHNNDSANWDNWKASVELHANEWWMSTTIGRMNVIVRETEKEFAYYRSQIEQEIVKIASHSKVSPDLLSSSTASLLSTQTTSSIESKSLPSVSQNPQILMPASKPKATPRN